MFGERTIGYRPVREIRDDMVRERAAATLAGQTPPKPEADRSIHAVLVARLRGNLPGDRRPWRSGTLMLHAADVNDVPVPPGYGWWTGVGSVLNAGNGFCDVWTRKAHKAYRKTVISVDTLAAMIYRGELVDGWQDGWSR